MVFKDYVLSPAMRRHMSWGVVGTTTVSTGGTTGICLLVLVWCSLMQSLRAADVIHGNFIMSDFGGLGTGTASTWRGYVISFKGETTVTALRGGATSDAFELAIFSISSNNMNTAFVQTSEVVVKAPVGRGGTVLLNDPIKLTPYQYYFIAQGRTSDQGIGQHYTAGGGYSTQDLKDSFSCIYSWGPMSIGFTYVLASEYEHRKAIDIPGASFNGINSVAPDLGLVAKGPLSCMCEAHESYEFTGVGDVECSPCPNGKVPSDDQIECEDCEHYEIAREDKECSACPNGTIPSVDQGACISCKVYEFAATQDSVCTACPNGTIPSDDQGGCIPCKVYEFSTTQDNVCTACPNGTIPSDDQGTCIRCKAYEIATQYDDECKLCPNGAVPDATRSACQLCPPGTLSLQNHTQCEECSPGYYTDKEGSSACTPCSKHSYQRWFGQSSCIWCSPGTYQLQTGQTKCMHWMEVDGLIPLQRPNRRVI